MSQYDYETGYTAGYDLARKIYGKTPGEWIRKKINDRHYHYVCSRCGCTSKYKKSNYCPDCGRPMQKGETE
jgi:rubrerythrin